MYTPEHCVYVCSFIDVRRAENQGADVHALGGHPGGRAEARAAGAGRQGHAHHDDRHQRQRLPGNCLHVCACTQQPVI